MCGIWGYAGNGQGFPVRDAWDGLCSLTDRGPDDWGMYVTGTGKVTNQPNLPDGDKEVILGNRRLSILDLSAAGNQPMGNHEDGLWLVYNGEVYNYQEIRQSLQKEGYSFDSDSDTEVILRAYQEYGSDCVKRFRGMFAFVIFDAERNELFGARDRFGIKPFYYCRQDQSLSFASEVTSLLEANAAERSLDRRSLDGFLTFGYVPGSETIVSDVKALDPGTTMSYDIDTGSMNVEEYWQPTFRNTRDGEPERIRKLLKESVSLRLRSDVPVGAFLSGGLDSSSIVALMRAVGGASREDLHTFSIGFNQEEASETAFAEKVAERFDTDHVSQTIDGDDVRKSINDIVASMDQPSIDGVNTYFVSRVAAEHDLKVVLSGLGSDELLYGYPSFDRVTKWYRAAKAFYRIPKPLRSGLGSIIEIAGAAVTELPSDKIADAVASEQPFGAAYLTERGLFTRSQRKKMLTECEPRDWTDVIEEDVQGSNSTTSYNDVSYAELTWYMNNQLLRDTDAMSMSHSLEVRVPFLDKRFAGYVMNASTESKRGGTKRLLKKAMGKDVPLEIIEREKSGFSFPFGEWLDDELSPVVERALSPQLLERLPISPERARSVYDGFLNGDIHWSRPWALVILSLWANKHL